jgi:radical SAM protein with 4Fe4S-binding SPASM domain
LHSRDSSLLSVAQNDMLAPSEHQLESAIATIEALRAAGKPIRFGNCIPQCYAPSSSTGCTAGSTFATIDPWGRMRPCNHAPWVAGDLRTQSVEAAWQGTAMEAWRALVPEGCAGCAAYARCHGGCRAQALLAGRECDPLMRGAVADMPAAEAEEELRLYGGLRPVGRYVRRHQGGKVVLVHRSQVVPVPPVGQDLWSGLDGSLTLRDVGERHGNAGLAWVGALHQRGMIHWCIDNSNQMRYHE